MAYSHIVCLILGFFRLLHDLRKYVRISQFWRMAIPYWYHLLSTWLLSLGGCEAVWLLSNWSASQNNPAKWESLGEHFLPELFQAEKPPSESHSREDVQDNVKQQTSFGWHQIDDKQEHRRTKVFCEAKSSTRSRYRDWGMGTEALRHRQSAPCETKMSSAVPHSSPKQRHFHWIVQCSLFHFILVLFKVLLR